MATPLPSELADQALRPGEQEAFTKFVETVHRLQKQGAEQDKTGLRRAFHTKTHVGALGTFRVVRPPTDTPMEGLFKDGESFPAFVRFSNGDTHATPDRHPQPRGIAVKLVGVEGEKVAGHESEITQDFLATSHSVTGIVRNARQFIAVIESLKEGRPQFGALAKSPDVGFLEACRIVLGLFWNVKLARVNSMATETYLGTAPIRWGPCAVKFAFRPNQPSSPAKNKGNPDYLLEDLVQRLSDGDILFDFVVQFFETESLTPIEDTSVKWKSELFKVGELVVPRCDAASSEGEALTDYVESLSFSPWHALAAHQPLGSIMRARRFAYPASAAARSGGATPSEPRSVVGSTAR